MKNAIARKWTREETILAFELYCLIPHGKDTVNNMQIKSLAKAINRSVSSVKLKLQNFKAYDPSYTKDGRVGLSHGSKLDEEICQEFLQNWDSLVVKASDMKAEIGIPATTFDEQNEITIPAGSDRSITRKERVGKSFFRQALLAAYDYKCCFTGLTIPGLLRASHIKPWAKSNNINEKTNPRNGLLLNVLHDTAFDKGYITITPKYEIIVSKALLIDNEVNIRYFIHLHGKSILLPSRFLPDKQFIAYHNNNIFVG